MSKHTPGPWIWGDRYHGLYGAGPDNAVLDYAGYEGMWLANVGTDRAKANARLIALAPKMYDYISAAASNGCEQAKRLIAKAGGNDE